MSLFSVFLIGISLSMDAFAVSIAKGMCVKGNRLRCALMLAFWFGAFQALMPLLGWLSGSLFESLITAIDHWIAFILLALIGGNMIREAIRGEDEDDADCNLALPHVLLLAVATSIDAFAVGITFAFLKVDILSSIAIIGVTTFLLCGGLSRQQAGFPAEEIRRHPGRGHPDPDRGKDPDRTSVFLTRNAAQVRERSSAPFPMPHVLRA